MFSIRNSSAALVLSLLAACGGGGGGSGPAPAQDFALRSAYQARMAAATSVEFTVSIAGICNGWATESVSAPVTATFEGAQVLAKSTTSTMTLTDCGGSATATGWTYYDAAYSMLGGTADGDYALLSPPMVVPETVRPGDSGTLGTATSWTSSAKTTLLGTVVYSYSVDTETASSAIVRLTGRAYDPSGTLLWTEVQSYRIEGSTLTPTLVTVQDTSGVTITMTPR